MLLSVWLVVAGLLTGGLASPGYAYDEQRVTYDLVANYVAETAIAPGEAKASATSAGDATGPSVMPSGVISAPREAVASWAMQWVARDDPGVEDRAVWSALKHLAGADLEAGPSDYLHGEEDMHAWIDELENADA